MMPMLLISIIVLFLITLGLSIAVEYISSKRKI